MDPAVGDGDADDGGGAALEGDGGVADDAEPSGTCDCVRGRELGDFEESVFCWGLWSCCCIFSIVCCIVVFG